MTKVIVKKEEEEKEAFWLTDYRERERNVLFNDALNTFYLRLYGVRHMVKDHSDSEKGNPLPRHRLLLSINSNGSFICTLQSPAHFLNRLKSIYRYIISLLFM